MSKKYEKMSFEGLQEAYRKAVALAEDFRRDIEKLKSAVEYAGNEYKKLQKELLDLDQNPRMALDDSEERYILEEIGKRILLDGSEAVDPDAVDPDAVDPDAEDQDAEDPDAEDPDAEDQDD